MRKFSNWAPPGVMLETYPESTFESARSDGRFDRSLGFIMRYIREQRPQLSMDKLAGASEFPAWRTAVRAKLRELLKMRPVDQYEVKLVETLARDGYRLLKYELYPEPYLAVPFWMLVPEAAFREHRKLPAVICSPGSGASIASLAGEPDNSINRYPYRNQQAWWYMRGGMIGIAMENPATAYNSEPDVEYGRVQLRFLSLLLQSGRTYAGFVTEQRLMVIDFLKHHELVDGSRLAVSGLSLGCGGVLYTALMSDDVQAAVYNDFVCSQTTRMLAVTRDLPTEYSASCGFIPGVREWFDIQPDLTAALAPKRLLLAEGGPWKGHLEKIVRAYEWAGHPEMLTLRYYPKYADPSTRKHDADDLRETTGLNGMEYLEDWANVDVSQHSFHVETALPWLAGIFFGNADFDAALRRDIERAVAESEVQLR